MDSVSVFLITPEGTIAHADVSDTEGKFNFSKVEIGKYVFKVDYNGILMAADNDTLVVSRDNQNFEILAMIGTTEISANISELSTNPENEYFNKLKIYPNPFKEKFFIQLGDKNIYSSYQLIDISGRIVKNGKLEQGSGSIEVIEISTSKLESGIYTLRIYNYNHSKLWKLIMIK